MATAMFAQGSSWGMHHISEADGWGIALTGMTIVFLALISISVLIALLPRVLDALGAYLPAEKPHGRPAPAARDDAAIVAVAAAMRHRDRNR